MATERAPIIQGRTHSSTTTFITHFFRNIVFIQFDSFMSHEVPEFMTNGFFIHARRLFCIVGQYIVLNHTLISVKKWYKTGWFLKTVLIAALSTSLAHTHTHKGEPRGFYKHTDHEGADRDMTSNEAE